MNSAQTPFAATPASGLTSPPAIGSSPPVSRRAAFAARRRELSKLITARADWVPVLLFATVLLSPEARIDLGGLQLFPYRLALFASLPSLAIKLMRDPIRVALSDLFFFGASAWIFIATAMHYPIDVAIKTGGANTFDALMAYLVGRTYFRSSLDVRRFLYRISPLMLGVAAVMIAESVSHRYLFRPFVGAITGHSPSAILARIYEIRNGFLRATGPFQHPISAGLFFASLLPLFIVADLPKRRLMGALACIGGVFSWSSAAIGTIAIGLLLGIYERLQKRYRIGWGVVIAAVLAGCIVIEVFSNGGLLRFIIRNAALNPQTGYFRIAIWDYGSADVLRHPWFGIGFFESYNRPKWMITDSVDNYWLLIGLRFGIPCVIMTVLSVLFTVISVGRVRDPFEPGALQKHRMAVGVCISLVVIYVSTISVAPWGAEMAWFTALLGMGGALADGAKRNAPAV